MNRQPISILLMKRHSIAKSILCSALLLLSAHAAQAQLFKFPDFVEKDASKRKHMGEVSEIITNGISEKDIKVSISPGNKMDQTMGIQIAVQVKGHRACLATASFEAMAIIRSSRPRGGYTDAFSCANIDGISMINTDIEAIRVDDPTGFGPKDAGDGYFFLTVMLDGKPSIFRIDSPYFKKAALNQDPLSVR
jgi:hypothetical protein